MRIAHIHIYGRDDKDFKYFINYLNIANENEKYYEVEDHEDGIEPRGNFLSKEIDYEAAEDGYASLNMPCWMDCSPYKASAVVYVLEDEIEKGKQLLQKALMENIDKQIKMFESLKASIQNAK